MTDALPVDRWEARRQSINDAASVAQLVEQLQAIAGDAEPPTPELPIELVRKAVSLLSTFEAKQLMGARKSLADALMLFLVDDFSIERHPTEAVNRHLLETQVVRWLRQVEGGASGEMADAFIDAAIHHGRAPYLQASASWVLQKIGLRRRPVVRYLTDVMLSDRDDACGGDTALAALCTLGVNQKRRAVLRKELIRRLKIRATPGLMSAARSIGDRAVLKALIPWIRVEEVGTLRDLAQLNVVSAVASLHPDDLLLQQDAWRLIWPSDEKRQRKHANAVMLGGAVAPNCNAPEVTASLMELLQTFPQPEASGQRYLIQLRLSECSQPQQLRGWQSSDALATLLYRDATADTKNATRMATSQDREKAIAWKTLLTAGDATCFAWLDAAVRDETSSFTKGEIYDLLSAFKLDHIPASVKAEVLDARDEHKDDFGGRFVTRQSATRLAASVGNWEALELLVNSRFTLDGYHLQSTADAIADVALACARIDRQRTWAIMHDACVSRAGAHRWVSTSAVELLALEALLPPGVARLIVELVMAQEIPALCQCQLLNALGQIDKQQIDAGVIAEVKSILDATEDALVREQARTTLWRWGDHAAKAEEFAELTDVADLPQMVRAMKAHRLGLWYASDPSAASAISAVVLTKASAAAASQMCSAVLAKKKQLKGQVASALITRLSANTTRWFGELELFRHAAALCPDELLAGSWEGLWQQWLPEARAALASAVASAGGTDRRRARELLSQLALDPDRSVRSNAVLGLADIDSGALIGLCIQLSSAETVSSRCRAAEMLRWLPARTGLASSLLTRLDKDEVLEVREAAATAREQRRRHKRADTYLKRVLATKRGETSRVLAAYRYGEALARIGDSTHREALRAARQNIACPTHLRTWYKQIDKELAKTIEKLENVPPSAQREPGGVVEYLEAAIAVNGSRKKVQLQLWREVAYGSRRSSWRAAIAHDEVLVIALSAKSEVGIEIRGRKPARALLSRTVGDVIVLQGTGPYPDREPLSGQ